MNILIGVLFLIVGFTAIFYPSLFFKSELLTLEKIQRNERIWKWVGSVFVLTGVADLVNLFL
jgi:hypothetical protein